MGARCAGVFVHFMGCIILYLWAHASVVSVSVSFSLKLIKALERIEKANTTQEWYSIGSVKAPEIFSLRTPKIIYFDKILSMLFMCF